MAGAQVSRESLAGGMEPSTAQADTDPGTVQDDTPLVYLTPVNSNTTQDALVLRLGQSLVLGRAKDAGATLGGTLVSRRHAKVEFTPGGLRVEDLESQNGTYLSEMRIAPGSPVWGRNGDLLRLGEHQFLIELKGVDPGGQEELAMDKTKCFPLHAKQVVEGFSILGQIGSGATSLVYSARDHSNNRPVAIKVLKRNLDDYSEWRERFLREGGVGQRIRSPHIVEIFDLHVDDKHVYLVMELVDGPSLKEMLKVSRLPVDQALKIAEEVALGLDAIHGLKIIHRDVKPGNILISSQGVTKLTDLGIAKDLGTHHQANEALTERFTGLGSLYYVSPEQAMDASEVDHRADIYSLGASLYEMLTGSPPVSPGPRLIYRIMNPQILPVAQVRKDCPAEIGHYVLGMLAKEPSQRPRSAIEAVAELRALRARYFPED